ncbi:Lrp/AsnC ligand binding domain-containing protein [Kribbella sp. NPDC006257]
MKVRTASTEQLQATLRSLHQVDGVTSTQTVVVLESCFERPPTVM